MLATSGAVVAGDLGTKEHHREPCGLVRGRGAHRVAPLGQTVSVIHFVGGGSQNEPLGQLTADRIRMPALAGPVEATAIDNVLVQARAQGFVAGDIEALRALVANAFAPRGMSRSAGSVNRWQPPSP